MYMKVLEHVISVSEQASGLSYTLGTGSPVLRSMHAYAIILGPIGKLDNDFMLINHSLQMMRNVFAMDSSVSPARCATLHNKFQPYGMGSDHAWKASSMLTCPAMGATIGCSIFIASKTSRVCPLIT